MVRLVLAGSDAADLGRALAILASKGWEATVCYRESELFNLLRDCPVPGQATVIIAQQVSSPFSCGESQSCHRVKKCFLPDRLASIPSCIYRGPAFAAMAAYSQPARWALPPHAQSDSRMSHRRPALGAMTTRSML